MDIINSQVFNGYKVQSQKGDLIENILIKNEQVLAQMLQHHKRIAAFRFELKFPSGYRGDVDIISKFFDSLRERLKSDLRVKTRKKKRTVNSELGYVWVKEVSANHGWHYHVVMFLNHDVYNCFGMINGPNTNMYSRILSSWASAIGITPMSAIGLVHVSKNPVYKLDVNSESIVDDMHVVLHRISYFAKVKTKPYGGGQYNRFFGTSKIDKKNELTYASPNWL